MMSGAIASYVNVITTKMSCLLLDKYERIHDSRVPEIPYK